MQHTSEQQPIRKEQRGEENHRKHTSVIIIMCASPLACAVKHADNSIRPWRTNLPPVFTRSNSSMHSLLTTSYFQVHAAPACVQKVREQQNIQEHHHAKAASKSILYSSSEKIGRKIKCLRKDKNQPRRTNITCWTCIWKFTSKQKFISIKK